MTLTATPDVSSTFGGWSPAPCAASFAMPNQDLTCTATFNIKSYLVTTSLSSGDGTINPSSQTVNYGATASFTVTVDRPFFISSITGCNGNFVGDTRSGGTYQTGPITAACTVTVTYEPDF